jgi:hypothetical protein
MTVFMRTCLHGLLLAMVCGSLSVRADEERPTDQTSPPPANTPNPTLPADVEVVSEARLGSVRYVALRGGGVAVVVEDETGPRVVQTLLAGQAVSRVLIVDGRLLAFVVSEAVHHFALDTPMKPSATLPSVPVRSLSTEAPVVLPTTTSVATTTASVATTTSATANTPTATATRIVGTVIEVSEGRVIVDHGTADGFVRGARIKVIAQRLVKKPDLQAGGVAMLPSNEVTAVVALEEAEATRSMAILGRGDVAMPGDLVELTDGALSESLWLPRRAPFNWRVGFVARPYLGISTDGTFPVGILADAYLTYTFDDVPLTLFAELSPIGTAVLGKEAHYPIVSAVGVAYTTDFVEIGLGGGALVGNKGPCEAIVDEIDTDGDGFADQFRERRDERVCESNTGATFNQVLRLGALDGVHFKWSSSIFARDTGFVFGVGRGEVALPVSSRLGLFAGGGGGENGWGYGEIGVRSLFGGAGTPGTLMLQASLGGAAIFDGPSREVVGGPLLAFGLEWRR